MDLLEPSKSFLPFKTVELLPAKTPLVTVAVCTRDRHHSLDRCLQSLLQLDYPNYEILVVDNSSKSPETAQLAARYNLRYVLEKRPGLDWARNRAVIEAEGEIVAFTDDDTVVDPDWLKTLVCTFQMYGADCVTGNVLPYQLETRAQRLFELYGGFSRGFKRRVYTKESPRGISYPLSSHHFGTGANMAFRKSLFEKIGYFNEALDVGTASNGAGDLEMFFRVIQSGHKLVFEPNALVLHVHRRDYKALCRQVHNNGVSYYAYLTSTFLHYPEERFRIVRFAVWWWFYWNVGRLLKEVFSPTGFPFELIFLEMLGAFKGPVAYFQARKQARAIAEGKSGLSQWLEGEV